MSEVKVTVSQIPKLLSDQTSKEILTKSFARDMGEMITKEMKDLISKGISPVRQAGRFPAYKAAKAARAQQKEARRLDRQGRVSDDARAAAEEARKGYPYSVMSRFPAKRERPVNLKLSGDQLRDLKFRVIAGSSGSAVEIGYFTKLSAQKESGHREGVNGQPSRPTIPDNSKGESFAVRISQLLRESLIAAIDKHLKG